MQSFGSQSCWPLHTVRLQLMTDEDCIVLQLSAAGLVPGRTSRATYEIAHLMMSDSGTSAPAETTTTCDTGCCVEAAGERRLLQTDETYIHPDEPCVVHICDVRDRL